MVDCRYCLICVKNLLHSNRCSKIKQIQSSTYYCQLVKTWLSSNFRLYPLATKCSILVVLNYGDCLVVVSSFRILINRPTNLVNISDVCTILVRCAFVVQTFLSTGLASFIACNDVNCMPNWISFWPKLDLNGCCMMFFQVRLRHCVWHMLTTKTIDL